ncbi:hypothetical protein RND71_036930 [Anisodus tanguticus]|uniref:Uncharacterized protein n=1 Tax=Anisodus tanguticus TaxID=243964 RepID=A0AAE1R2P6_9SOLA|nr:hypothetical protein RND71_036930 [Anisodus tanguticus]
MGTSKACLQGREKTHMLHRPKHQLGTRRRHDSEDQSISIYKNHCLGHATQKDRKTARSKKTLLEPGTSQAPSPTGQVAERPLDSATRVGYGIAF